MFDIIGYNIFAVLCKNWRGFVWRTVRPHFDSLVCCPVQLLAEADITSLAAQKSFRYQTHHKGLVRCTLHRILRAFHAPARPNAVSFSNNSRNQSTRPDEHAPPAVWGCVEFCQILTTSFTNVLRSYKKWQTRPCDVTVCNLDCSTTFSLRN